MKKLSIIFGFGLLLTSLVSFAPNAYAGNLQQDAACDDDPYGCVAPLKCELNQAAGSKFCVGEAYIPVGQTGNNPNAVPTAPTPGPAPSPAASTGGTIGGSANFQSLTSIPAIQEFKANGFAGFFNQLYVLAVGAASVLAVLQFIRAGILYSLGDTGVTEKREARQLMVMSVLGLVLVLSPTIVFGIINPNILQLQISTTDLTPSTYVASNSTCQASEVTRVINRDPAAGETWNTSSSCANFYGQECTLIAKLPPGSRCSVTSTTVGGGQYCKCAAITNQWHLFFGNGEDGGLAVQYRTNSAPDGTGLNCMLGAGNGINTYYPTEDACKAAYASEGQIVSLIQGGLLGPYASGTCLSMNSALRGMGGTPPTGVKITGPALCAIGGTPTGGQEHHIQQ